MQQNTVAHEQNTATNQVSHQQQKLIFAYIDLFIAFDPDVGDKYYIYDPATDKHHEVSKRQYNKVMKEC